MPTIPIASTSLILSQTDIAVEVWSRSNDWKGLVFRSPDDRIDLPEFGFSCAVRDLYARTDLARDARTGAGS